MYACMYVCTHLPESKHSALVSEEASQLALHGFVGEVPHMRSNLVVMVMVVVVVMVVVIAVVRCW